MNHRATLPQQQGYMSISGLSVPLIHPLKGLQNLHLSARVPAHCHDTQEHRNLVPKLVHVVLVN